MHASTHMTRRTHYALLPLLLLAVIAAGQESSLTAYSGFTEPAYSGVDIQSTYVRMRDGVRLAVDYYRPTGGPARRAFPVVFMYTPYKRATLNPETGEVRDLTTSDPVARMLLAHGYAMAYADMRGTGASSGWLLDFMPEIWEDGKELVDWIAAQPWCDGNVGMMGASYLGWSQTATASRRPAALKCIMPTVIPLEGYTGEIYPGGIYLQGFMQLWSSKMFPSQRSYFDPEKGLIPARPAQDEDGDGDLADEIPLDQDGSGTFLDDGYPPVYSDGEAREHVFYDAIKAHLENYDYDAWAKAAFFIDARSPLGHTLNELGPNAHVPALMESGLPIYNVGGWFDGFARGSFELYCTLASSNPSKLIMFPGYHRVTRGPYYEDIGYATEEADAVLAREHLRFFDRYLKGIENRIEQDAPIQIYVMHGEGWRGERTWPLAREVRTPFYLDANRTLSGARGAAGITRHTADYRHSSVYGDSEGNRWVGISGRHPSALPDRRDKAAQSLSYTGEPLAAAMEVTGHPSVTLRVSSTEAYGDFFVYLEDVSPDGAAVLVTEGQLRAGFHRLQDNDLIVAAGGVDVLPDLPWHGFRKEDYVKRALADGAELPLTISLQPTAWVFREGHCVRLSIACSDWPTFRLHPRLSPANHPDDPGNRVPTITVHHGGDSGSVLELPVIPQADRVRGAAPTQGP